MDSCTDSNPDSGHYTGSTNEYKVQIINYRGVTKSLKSICVQQTTKADVRRTVECVCVKRQALFAMGLNAVK